MRKGRSCHGSDDVPFKAQFFQVVETNKHGRENGVECIEAQVQVDKIGQSRAMTKLGELVELKLECFQA